jgi:RNA-directed DNA polymerase
LRNGAQGAGLNETKTQITNLDEGVDFVGFTIRRFRGALLTEPSTTRCGGSADGCPPR